MSKVVCPKGSPYGHSCCAENAALRTEVLYEQERNANNVKAYSEEVERLRRLVDVAGREEGYAIDQAEALEARIEAALAECEGTEECDVVCNLASRVVKALKGRDK